MELFSPEKSVPHDPSSREEARKIVRAFCDPLYGIIGSKCDEELSVND
jgi:hypothetical protein